MIGAGRILDAYREAFHETPLLVRSPGRVNLIGEHTDYNQGFVLPGAIDKALYLAVGARNDNELHLLAVDKRESWKGTIHDRQRSHLRWPDFLLGVVSQLRRHGYPLKGFNCVFGGDIPIGAGLSSSAAIEAGLVSALNQLFGLNLDLLVMARIAQQAENEFVGVQCGIMDPFVNLAGVEDTVLRIDCRSLEYVYVPFRYPVSIVLFDTKVSHELASSEYNTRRRECEEGVARIRIADPTVLSLRDVTLQMLEAHRYRLDPTVFRRCKFVIEENQRVLDACEALEQHNLVRFGELMCRSHEGLMNDYSVSCQELDLLVEAAGTQSGVIGSRMMGGGFGGCTINLINPDAVEEVTARVSEQFHERYQRLPGVYITSIGQGTSTHEVTAESYR